MTTEELYDKIEVLKEIQKLLKENALDGFNLFPDKIDRYIKLVETFHKFGINKNIYYNTDYSIEYGIGIYEYSEILNVKKLEEKETLLRIGFPTGGYIFGDNYDYQNFENFFKELKEFTNPKYVDKLNHDLFYDCTNSKTAYESYLKIYDKYEKLYRKRQKEIKAKRLEAELNRLKKEV